MELPLHVDPLLRDFLFQIPGTSGFVHFDRMQATYQNAVVIIMTICIWLTTNTQS